MQSNSSFKKMENKLKERQRGYLYLKKNTMVKSATAPKQLVFFIRYKEANYNKPKTNKSVSIFMQGFFQARGCLNGRGLASFVKIYRKGNHILAGCHNWTTSTSDKSTTICLGLRLTVTRPGATGVQRTLILISNPCG